MTLQDQHSTDAPDIQMVSRRGVLQKAAMGSVLLAAGMVLPGCGGSGDSSTTTTATSSDADILNFALNLEYLEAEFYSYATTGAGIDAQGVGVGGTGTAGATTGGGLTTFIDDTTKSVAFEIASNERDHVNFLRTALGAAAVAKPAINLAALGDFSSQAVFLRLARAFEDVGVSAYGGAAPLIQSKVYLQAAAQILAAEALHTGNIRLLIAQQNISTTAVDRVDIIPPISGTKFFSLSSNSLSVIRTPRQVLDIVYGRDGATMGGFFPAGMNGKIHA